MDITFKTCVFSFGESPLNEKLDQSYLLGVGFDVALIDGDYHNLFSYVSKNKIDIVVIDSFGVAEEDLAYVVDIIYKNFCENIILVTNEDCGSLNADYVVMDDWHNFDLKFYNSLLACKRKIEKDPHYNTALIKTKVSEILLQMMFSAKYDGFKYFVEASTRAFLKYPYDYSTMELYKEVGEKYGKTSCAVEKCMRKVLCEAFSNVKNASLTPETAKIKSTFTYDMTNNSAISMIVSQLLLDKSLEQNHNLIYNQA